jgi:dTDP-4-dehydrorhamnose reductase
MRVLVTGVQGQLGYDVMTALKLRGHEPIGVDIAEMDITNEEQVRTVIISSQVSGVIHCAAYTAVDAAQDNIQIAHKVNADGTRYIAKVCGEYDIKLIYISTDYVFNGQGNQAWDTEDTPEPLNVYGASKYEGECAVQEFTSKYFIVRIAWVFGVNGKNFVKTMLTLGKKNGNVNVVNDQTGSPTFTLDLSVLLVDMMESNQYGIYHATNEGECTWYEFAKEIFLQAQLDVTVTPVDSSAFVVKAARPKNSRMRKDKLTANGFHRLPDWKDALHRYLILIGEIE